MRNTKILAILKLETEPRQEIKPINKCPNLGNNELKSILTILTREVKQALIGKIKQSLSEKNQPTQRGKSTVLKF